MSRDLVIVRAGRQSTHRSWTSAGVDAFDLLIANYEELPSSLLARARESVLIPGAKVAGWRDLFQRSPDLLARYDQIALLDDDLLVDPEGIAASFAIGRQYGLSLWQPSLTWDSYFSYGIFLHNPIFELRYVNFIEMMCPFFSAAHLKLSLPLFDLGLETGIDRLWCRLRSDSHKAYAVLDSVQILHSRPVGTYQSRQGFSDARNAYQDAVTRMEDEFGLPFRGPVSYAGVTKDGRRIEGRVPMAMRALVPLLGWTKSVNRGWFWRPVTDHARHILLRPIGNEPIDVCRLQSMRRVGHE